MVENRQIAEAAVEGLAADTADIVGSLSTAIWTTKTTWHGKISNRESNSMKTTKDRDSKHN